MKRSLKRSRGTSIVETIAGLFILIPLLLALVDVAVAVLAQTANDAMCKSAARAAAESQNVGQAEAAAQTAVDRFPAAGYIISKGRPQVTYNANVSVRVITEITWRPPVQIPFSPRDLKFVTDVTEPVVGTL